MCLCVCVRGLKDEDAGKDKWVSTGWAAQSSQMLLIWCDMQWYGFICTGRIAHDLGRERNSVRGACWLANSHHQRNYIHKHGTLSCHLTCLLTAIWAFWDTNICCRFFSLCYNPEISGADNRMPPPHPASTPISRSSSKNKDILRETDWMTGCYSAMVLCRQDEGRRNETLTEGLPLLHVSDHLNLKHYTAPAPPPFCSAGLPSG